MDVVQAVLVFACFVTAGGCVSERQADCRPGEAKAVNDLLYFGTAMSSGRVAPAQWTEFLRTSVTPRFPLGLTAWEASGQWQDEDRRGPVSEASYVQSVLRVTSRVCAAF